MAGTVAGMTAVFGTPVAALLMAVELLLFELHPRSLFDGVVAPTALPHETCRAVATRLATLKLERLPVVESGAAPRLPGIVSRGDLIDATAGLYAEEHERSALRRLPLARRPARV